MMRVNILLTGLLCLMCSTFVQAEYDAANLDKLFTDKSQRAQIDAARSGNYTGSDIQQTSKVNVNGYMKRSDGKSVVWINNKNTLEGSKVGNIKVHQRSVGKNKKVSINVDGKSASLRPGETWHKETGAIVDSH